MKEEMDALEGNDTWELVHLPPMAKLVRLVAKGFTQILGKDYNATFAPVAKLTTVCLLISLAASQSWPLHQLDVKNAFLNGNLDEIIYMDPPPSFRTEGEYLRKVCHLQKSLYDHKQSPVHGLGASIV